MRRRIVEFVPGLIAGVLGGVAADLLLGYLLRRSGLWMPIIAGAIVGLACGQASPVASRARGVLIALYTLALVVVIQWQLWEAPFDTDGTLADYVRQLPGQLRQFAPMTLGAMAINVALAYYWGREQGIRFARRSPALGVGTPGGGPPPATNR